MIEKTPDTMAITKKLTNTVFPGIRPQENKTQPSLPDKASSKRSNKEITDITIKTVATYKRGVTDNRLGERITTNILQNISQVLVAL